MDEGSKIYFINDICTRHIGTIVTGAIIDTFGVLD